MTNLYQYILESQLFDNQVSLIFFGDNIIHPRIAEMCKTGDGFDFTRLYKRISKDIKKFDIASINQETIIHNDETNNISSDEVLMARNMKLSCGEELAECLGKAGFNLATVATNHSGDLGLEGIEDTVNLLEKHGITAVGKVNQDPNITYVEKKGVKLAFLCYTKFHNFIDEEHSMPKFDKYLVSRDISEARKNADIVVVMPHWGFEYELIPDEVQNEYAHLFCECGADICVGTHPHVVNPVEEIYVGDHKMLCFWSIGNSISSTSLINSTDKIKDDDTSDRIFKSAVGFAPRIYILGNKVHSWDINPVIMHVEKNNACLYFLKDYTQQLADKNLLLKASQKTLTDVYKFVQSISSGQTKLDPPLDPTWKITNCVKATYRNIDNGLKSDYSTMLLSGELTIEHYHTVYDILFKHLKRVVVTNFLDGDYEEACELLARLMKRFPTIYAYVTDKDLRYLYNHPHLLSELDIERVMFACKDHQYLYDYKYIVNPYKVSQYYLHKKIDRSTKKEKAYNLNESISDDSLEELTQLYKTCCQTKHTEGMRKLLSHKLDDINGVEYEVDSYGNILVTKGDVTKYPVFVAHIDERQPETEREIKIVDGIVKAYEGDKQVGYGADDKNGVWIALNLLREYDNIKVVFFNNEEQYPGAAIGTEGSRSIDMTFFDDAKYVISCDKSGSTMFAITACRTRITPSEQATELAPSDFFPRYLVQKYGFDFCVGGRCDVLQLKENGLNVPCANFSSGYYEEHTSKEYTVLSELENAYKLTKEIIELL